MQGVFYDQVPTQHILPSTRLFMENVAPALS
jgi:hypothetical protein